MDESRGTGQLEPVRRPDGASGNHAAGPPALIQFHGVGHTYRSLRGRTIRAVDDFSLEIHSGEVFGLAGPNGAGKSTLIALLLGFLEPTDGMVRVDAMRPRDFVEANGIGYLSELISIPPRWKVEEALTRYAILAGVPRERLEQRLEEAIELLGLHEQRGKRVKQLSKGNLQRLGLAQALLRDERLIILDEPTHGLDPVWTQRFRDVVESLRKPGRTIFIASHNLDELQRLADRVAIIDGGRLQRVVEPRGRDGNMATPYVIQVVGADSLEFPGAEARGEGEFALPPLDLAALNAGVARLMQRGALISSLRPAHSVLEQHFREAVGE
jgi:ABC-2 type transport system ATP-binding protein